MDYFNLVLILVIVLLVGVCFKFYRDKKQSEAEAGLAECEKNECVELGRGLAEYNQKMQERKNQAKIKILEMLNGNPPSPEASARRGKISNRDAAKALNVSRASAVRYLDELENEGKLKQVGKVGKYVYYSNM